MEPATMSDVKELMKDLLKECRESIKEAVAEAFGNSKPALEHATTSNASQLLAMDANICVTEVAGVVSERIPMSAVLQGSSSSASIVKESPEDIHSASTRFITTVPVTCSTDCSPEKSMYAPMLVASLTEYNIDNSKIPAAAVPLAMRCEFSSLLAPTVHVQRPMPWPSFMSVHADGDEARPLPWPSFKDIKGYKFLNDAGEKASWLCNSDSSHAEVCVATTFNISDFYVMMRSPELKLVPIGSVTVLVDSRNFPALTCAYLGVDTIVYFGSWLFAGCLLAVCWKSPVQPSTDCYIAILIVAGLCSIMDWHLHLLDFPCRPVITACLSCFQAHCHYFCSSQWKEKRILNSRRSKSSYAQFCCAIQNALCWPGNSVIGIHMHIRVACSIRQLLLIGYVIIVPFLNLAKVLFWPKKQHSELLYVSGRCLEKFSGMFHTIQNTLTYILQHGDSCRPKSAVTRLQLTTPGMYLCLSACLEAVVWVLCIICSLHMLIPHKCMHGNSTTTKYVQSVACPNNVLYLQTLFLLDAHLIMVKCKQQVAVHSNCSTDSQLLGTKTTWHFGSYQSLTCEPCWKQFCEEFSQNLYFDQTFLMAHRLRPAAQGIYTDLLNCEPFEESCCCIRISSDFHSSILLVVSGELGWGSQDADFYEIGSELPLHLVWTCSTCDEHEPFQGGRYSLAITTFFEQVSAGDKHYLDFNQVCASDNYHMATSFVWAPVDHDCCSNFGYYHDSTQVKDHRLQWDPGGFSSVSAWGQAEFQGGRGVSNLACVLLVGRSHGLATVGSAQPFHHRCYIYPPGSNEEAIQRITEPAAAAATRPTYLTSSSLPSLCSSIQHTVLVIPPNRTLATL